MKVQPEANPEVKAKIDKLMKDYDSIIEMIRQAEEVVNSTSKPLPFDESLCNITAQCVYDIFQSTINRLIEVNTPTEFDKYSHKKI